MVPETGLAREASSPQNKKVPLEALSIMVPETGLEPAHQMAYAPKAYVYTNFTTRAYISFQPDVIERAHVKYILIIS